MSCVLLAFPAFAQDKSASAPAQPISLEQAFISAYTTNPRLQAARAELKAVDEEVAIAASGFRPSIEAGYDKGRRRLSVGSQPWRYSDTETRSLTAEQPLFRGGRTLAEMKTARARVKQARAELLNTEQQVLLDAVTAYADVALALEELELNQNNVTVLARQLEVTQARFDAGDVTRTDTAQAESRAANAQALLARAESNLQTASVEFHRVTGVMPAALTLPDDVPPLPATVQEAEAIAMEAAPLARAAEMNLRAAKSTVWERTGVLLPEISLLATARRTEGGGVPGFSNNFDDDQLTVNVRIPLYQSGAEYARLRAAKDQREEAKYTAMDARQAARETAGAFYYDYHATQKVITSAQSAVDAADTALTGLRDEYEYGERTTLDVLDVEQDFFARKVELSRARRDRLVLGYGLLASLGRLNATFLALPVEIYDPVDHYDATKWLPIGF